MTTKRTTVAADEDDLLVLQGEARRRGVPLAAVLREAVEAEAARLRQGARPRFGVGRSGGEGAARVAAGDPEAPYRERRGS
jgi:hypothetical protein